MLTITKMSVFSPKPDEQTLGYYAIFVPEKLRVQGIAARA